MTTKFKKGDRVRRTGRAWSGVRPGDINVVTVAVADRAYIMLEGQGAITFDPDQFELVEPSATSLLFRKGDRVWSQRWGWGTVSAAGERVVVKFDACPFDSQFQLDGRAWRKSTNRELFFAEAPAPTPAMLNRPATVLFPKGAVVAFASKGRNSVHYRKLAADLLDTDTSAIIFHDGTAIETAWPVQTAWPVSSYNITLVSNPATKEQSA